MSRLTKGRPFFTIVLFVTCSLTLWAVLLSVYGPIGPRGEEYDQELAHDRSQGGEGASDTVQTEAQPEEEEYWLQIKGESHRLSPEARERMEVWRQAALRFAQSQSGKVIINGPQRKEVALTFDDGPDETNTQAIIDILDRYHVKSSFFFVGSNIEKYPETVKKAEEKGHLVLNHSYSHPVLTELSEEEQQEELERTNELIYSLIGKRPAMVRPPYGEIDNAVLDAVLTTGSKAVLWSLDTLDWSLQNSLEIADNVKRYVRSGEIILLHSGVNGQATAEALPDLIEHLLKEGYTLVRLDELLNVPAYQ